MAIQMGLLKIINKLKFIFNRESELEYVQRKFDEYNKLYFNGELPSIPLKIDNTLGDVWGRFESLTDIRENTWTPVQILLNMQNLREETVLRNVFVHEMVHYWDCVNNQPTKEQWEEANKIKNRFYPVLLENAGNKFIWIGFWQTIHSVLDLHFEDDHSPKFKEKCHELNEKFLELHLSEQIGGPRL
jgi:hypothetical protein